MGSRWFRLFAFVFMMVVLSGGTMYMTRGTQPLPELPEIEHPLTFREVGSLPTLPVFQEFIRWIDHELDSTHTVGAAYTIVQGGEIVYTGTYGERSRGGHQPVDEHTLFRLASVSKGFTGVLACLLERDGVFSLSDKVVDLYPGFHLKDSLSTAELTIRDLLSHTSGLVPYAFDNLVEAGQDLPTIIDRLDEVDISAPPGELYGYQNVMFSMLDPIASSSTGIPYQVLLKDRIFRPLGMEDASAGPVDLERNPNMAHPHVSTRSGYRPLDPRKGYYNVMPAAGVNASISDMGQWLLALLGYKPQWMPDAVLDSIATPVIYTPLKWQYTRYWKPFRERHYSLGWRIYYYQGREILYHGGYIRGCRAEIAFCPAEDVGVAFLMNSPNSLASRFVPTFFDLFLE